MAEQSNIENQTIYKNQIKLAILLVGLMVDYRVTVEDANSIIDNCDLTQEMNLATEYYSRMNG